MGTWYNYGERENKMNAEKTVMYFKDSVDPEEIVIKTRDDNKHKSRFIIRCYNHLVSGEPIEYMGAKYHVVKMDKSIEITLVIVNNP